MFFKLVSRNSKRSRRENGLFHASLLVVVIAFYVILALPKQDVIIFLKEMESDAIQKIFQMVPILFGASLCILFFLVYFAGRYQMERRKHEFGVYRMMGMSRSRLFFMLMTEDIKSSLLILVAGIPVAVCISELVSLITAKVEGLGILGHQSTFSFAAVIGTAVGFILVKLFACLFLSGAVVKDEIGNLMNPQAKEQGKTRPKVLYVLAFATGCVLLFVAFYDGIRGHIWDDLLILARTVVFGIAGVFLVFYGFRLILEQLGRWGSRHERLGMFTFRQLEEMFIRKSSVPAVSCILILAALCLFGAGIGIARSYTVQSERVVDYTFDDDNEDVSTTIEKLQKSGLRSDFQKLIQIKTGYIESSIENLDKEGKPSKKKNRVVGFNADELVDKLKKDGKTPNENVFAMEIEREDTPHIIALSGYNELLKQAGEKPLALKDHQAAVYLGSALYSDEFKEIMSKALQGNIHVTMDGKTWSLGEKVMNKEIVADRAITLGFALIVPDKAYEQMTAGNGTTYLDGVLKPSKTEKQGLIRVYQEMNQKLDKVGISYDCFLQSLGRRMFYGVCASYITIYLAVIFLIIGNTVISVQFLTNQQKIGRRYQTLIRLGATSNALCRSARKQINWYFGIPVFLGAAGSIPAMASLFSLFVETGEGTQKVLLLSASGMILLLLIVELIYILEVKKLSDRYLLYLMVPEREE